MHKNLPIKFSELLASHYQCVWSSVVLIEHNSSPIGQIWPFLGDCFLQTIQLLTVQFRVKRFAVEEQLIVGDSLPILPNTQQNLPGHQSWLSHRFSRLTVIRPRPFSLDLVVCDSLFIASHQPLQKWVDFVAIQQRFAEGNTVHKVVLLQLVWHSFIELLFVSNGSKRFFVQSLALG